MSRPFVARVCHRPNGSSVVVEGEIDLTTAHRFVDAIDEAVRGSSDVEIDLRSTTFMGSVGLHALLDAQLRLAEPIVLVDPSPPMMRLLEVAEVVGVFPVRRNHDRSAAVDTG